MFDDGIQIMLFAEFMKFIAQACQMSAGRQVYYQLHRKHSRTGVSGVVLTGVQICYLNRAFRKKGGQSGNDAFLINADDVNAVRNGWVSALLFAGDARGNGQVSIFLKFRESLFYLGDGMPVGSHQYQHGKFLPEGGHPALQNAATGGADGFAQVFDQSGSVRADSRDGKKFFHRVGFIRVNAAAEYMAGGVVVFRQFTLNCCCFKHSGRL
jgi:hypothetical protein